MTISIITANESCLHGLWIWPAHRVTVKDDEIKNSINEK